MSIQRSRTGITELDQILRGGIPKGNVVLLAGGSGMGKTTLCTEFLAHGADEGEPGLFLSVTEPVPVLKRNLGEYAFFNEDHLQSQRIRLADLRAIYMQIGVGQFEPFTSDQTNNLVDAIIGIVKEYKIKRLIIDSITAICQRIAEPNLIRDFIFQLGLSLSEMDCTCILTSETPPRQVVYSMFGVEEFISDGIIFLSELERGNDLIRTLQVMKMRGTEHSRAKFMMDISEFGISLAPMLREFLRGDEA